MMLRDSDIIAATLCGCTIEQIAIVPDQGIVFELDEPRSGRLVLSCAEATIAPAILPAVFLTRAAWARKVDWADIAADGALQLFLANGDHFALRSSHMSF
jgi:hypothetical protein